jgi:hypothetical protein
LLKGLSLSILNIAVAGAIAAPSKFSIPVASPFSSEIGGGPGADARPFGGRANRTRQDRGNPNAFNPQMAIVGDFAAVLKDDGLPDGERRRADFREIEFGFKADADPFLTVEAYIAVAKEDGETHVEAEEVFGRYSRLSRGLQAKFGKIAAAFGRVQRNHADQLNYLNFPAPLRDLLGEEGLRAPGASLSYLFPGDRFFEITAEAYDAGDEGPVFNGSSFEEPVYAAHARTFFDFNADTSAQLGVSYLSGPGMESSRKGNALGVDFTAKWQPGTKGRSATFEAEAFWAKRPEGGGRKLGWFARFAYEVTPRGFLTLGYDHSELPFVESKEATLLGKTSDPERTGWIAGFTYKVTEFHHWRLEWEQIKSNFEDTRKVLTLQFQWVIGAHPAHRY